MTYVDFSGFFCCCLSQDAAEVHNFQAVFWPCCARSQGNGVMSGEYYFYTVKLTGGLVPGRKSVLEFSQRNFHDAQRVATS